MPRASRLLPLICLLVSLCAPALAAQRGFFAMDTYMAISVEGENAEEALEAAEARVRELEALWSVTDENSEIYALNHAGGEAVAIGADTEAILRFGAEMGARTGGCLDVTLYPVSRLWGFTTGDYRVPSETELAAALALVDFEQLELSPGAARLPEGAQVDLGALGKGWAGDEAIAVLRKYGVTSALLDLGGNVQALGSKADGSAWRVGIVMPEEQTNFCVLEVRDAAVVTSGNYERFFTADDGAVYGHILDPRTGAPVENGLKSVTIIGAGGKKCDALSTALFVMGRDAAIEHWRTYGDFDMVLLTEENEVYITEGLRDGFSLAQGYEGLAVTVVSQ